MESFSLNGREHVRAACEVCGTEYVQQLRLWKKAVWQSRCKNHRQAIHQCRDCGTSVSSGSERCKPCSGKNRRTVKPRYCIDCGTEINRKAKSRCLSCWNKEQDKGATRARTKFNASKAWAKARTACFERDDYTCQHCSVRGGVYLEAHHIQEWCNYPDLRLDVSNLLTLCRRCHKAHHAKEGRPRRWAA